MEVARMTDLRKEFKKKVVEPYSKRKHVVDLPILERIYNIRKTHLLMVIAAAVFFLFNRKYFLFSIMTISSAFFSFYHSKFNRTPMDFKLPLVFGIFITRYYGIGYTMIFFILSDVVPSLLGGESLDAAGMTFNVWFFIVNALVYLFPTVPIMVLGPILVIVEAIGSFFINSFFGIPGIMSIFVSILTSLIRIIYFFTIGRVVEFLLNTI